MTSVLIRGETPRHKHTQGEECCVMTGRDVSAVSTVKDCQETPRIVCNHQKLGERHGTTCWGWDPIRFIVCLVGRLVWGSCKVATSFNEKKKTKANVLAGPLCYTVSHSNYHMTPNLSWLLSINSSHHSQRGLGKTQIRWCHPSSPSPLIMTHWFSGKH